MDVNICANCGKPIVGYWYELREGVNFCLRCGGITTVKELFEMDLVEVKPDTFEGEGVEISDESENSDSDSDAEEPFSEVTDKGAMKNYMENKAAENAAYGAAVMSM